jgi:hypothetical protein
MAYLEHTNKKILDTVGQLVTATMAVSAAIYNGKFRTAKQWLNELPTTTNTLSLQLNDLDVDEFEAQTNVDLIG